MATPVFFDSINRAAVLLTPQKPFFDWIKSIDNQFNPEEALEPGLYLIPDYETPEDMEEWINVCWDELFTDQMNGWYMDERMWIKNRSLAMFRDCFSITLIPLILDTCDDPLERY